MAVDLKLRRFADYKNVTFFNQFERTQRGVALGSSGPTDRDSMIHAVDTLMNTLDVRVPL